MLKQNRRNEILREWDEERKKILRVAGFCLTSRKKKNLQKTKQKQRFITILK